jgi:hypothetical protein
MSFEISFAVSEGAPREQSSVKVHAVCGTEDLALLLFGFLQKRNWQVTKIVTAKQT